MSTPQGRIAWPFWAAQTIGLLALAFYCLVAVAAPSGYLPTFPVLGRSIIQDTNAQKLKLKLAPADRAMVQQKKELILGFANDIPPFEITISGQDYEGLTADFASLVSQLLNIKITARRYPDRLTARAALERGEIDCMRSSPTMPTFFLAAPCRFNI